MTTVLIIGSGPNAVASRDWPRTAFDHIVAINNAWAVRPDWDYLIHPDDFPAARRPVDVAPRQKVITSEAYVPAQNDLGGFVYAGGTMAFTAGYWALQALRPDVIATDSIACLTHLKPAIGTPVVHTIELLDWAHGGPPPTGLDALSGEITDVPGPPPLDIEDYIRA